MFMATSARHVYVYVCFHVYACGSKTRGGMLRLKYVCIHVHIHMYAYKDKALVRIEHLVHGRLLCLCLGPCQCLCLCLRRFQPRGSYRNAPLPPHLASIYAFSQGGGSTATFSVFECVHVFLFVRIPVSSVCLHSCIYSHASIRSQR